MPYISQQDRDKFEIALRELDRAIQTADNCTAGDMNYLFTSLCVSYLNRKGLSYTHMNDLIGALEGCKLELYRRQTSPYEDLKIEENGDVY